MQKFKSMRQITSCQVHVCIISGNSHVNLVSRYKVLKIERRILKCTVVLCINTPVSCIVQSLVYFCVKVILAGKYGM